MGKNKISTDRLCLFANVTKRVTVFTITLTLLAACSSPESDGRKAARKSCDCYDDYTADLNKAYASYIGNFESYSFKTRIDARNKLNEAVLNVEDKYEKCEKEAVAYREKLNNKYLGNKEKNEQFIYAYTTQNRAIKAENVNISDYRSRIDELILRIIPPKPGLEKLKNDLTGRKITEQPDGYFERNWFREIKSGKELKEVNIRDKTDKGDHYILDVQLVLQGENSDYEANVIITYVLRQYDDWTIDFIESKELHIVKTGKYDNCIDVRLWGMLGEHRYDFTNKCDVALLIGGVVLSNDGTTWTKFSRIVDANSTVTIGDIIYRIRDYKIHFIERP